MGKNVSRESRIGVACPVVLLYFSFETRSEVCVCVCVYMRMYICVCIYARIFRKYILGENGGSIEMAEKLAPFNCNFHGARIHMKIRSRYSCRLREKKCTYIYIPYNEDFVSLTRSQTKRSKSILEPRIFFPKNTFFL